MSLPTIIIPAPHQQAKIDPGYFQKYDEILCEKCGYPTEVPGNVQFEHNPNWRQERVISIQVAREAHHPMWATVRMLWIAAQIAFAFAWFAYSMRPIY